MAKSLTERVLTAPFHSWMRVKPDISLFTVGNRKKSAGARTRINDGCWRIWSCLTAIQLVTTATMYMRTLSQWNYCSPAASPVFSAWKPSGFYWGLNDLLGINRGPQEHIVDSKKTSPICFVRVAWTLGLIGPGLFFSSRCLLCCFISGVCENTSGLSTVMMLSNMDNKWRRTISRNSLHVFNRSFFMLTLGCLGTHLAGLLDRFRSLCRVAWS